MRNILGNIILANKMFEFIKDGDKIAIGISGGKDSLILWLAMDLYCRKLKEKHNWNVETIGVHVKMNYYDNIDYSHLDNWVEKNNLKLKYVESQVGEILKLNLNKKGMVQCSLCSKMKKAICIDEAKKNGFNKIAMGHHMDDAIETLFMNMLSEGRIATFKPSTYLDRSDVTLIRPIILVREKHIISLTRKMNLPIIKNMCPNETNTQRAYMKDFLEKQFYKNPQFKNSYINLYNSMINGDNAYLWFMEFGSSINKSNDLKKNVKINKDIK